MSMCQMIELSWYRFGWCLCHFGCAPSMIWTEPIDRYISLWNSVRLADSWILLRLKCYSASLSAAFLLSSLWKAMEVAGASDEAKGEQLPRWFWRRDPMAGLLRTGAQAIEAFYFIFIFKKTKFQKYMPNREIFKNGGRQDLNIYKKLHLGPGAQGALNSELVKSI